MPGGVGGGRLRSLPLSRLDLFSDRSQKRRWSSSQYKPEAQASESPRATEFTRLRFGLVTDLLHIRPNTNRWKIVGRGRPRLVLPVSRFADGVLLSRLIPRAFGQSDIEP